MTVSSSVSTQTFACNGSTTVFTCNFRVLEASELVGYLITVATNESTPLVNGTDFAVTGVGAANAIATTTLTYSSAYQVNFRRRTARLQSTDYRDNDPFPAESHEVALDRLTHITQEVDADVGRSLLAPEPESGFTLPAAADRAGLLLGFDDDGAPIAVAPVSGSAADLALQLAGTGTGEGAAMVGFNPAGTGAVARTVQAKLRETVSVADFGAVGDGVTDDTAAIQAAITYVMSFSTNRPKLVFPSGNYLISANLVIPLSAFKGIAMQGNGKTRSRITASGACTAIFDFSAASSGSNYYQWVDIEGIDLLGNGVAQYGILATWAAHARVARCQVQGTSVAGISLSYAFSSDIEAVDIFSNTGSGLVLSNSPGANNNVNLRGVRSFANTEFGLDVNGGYAIQIEGCAIEENKAGGIYIGPSSSVEIASCYFENNGEDGHDFSSPTAVNVKADVIINGTGSKTTISDAFASTVTVHDCIVASAFAQCFVYAAGANGLKVFQNKLNTGTPALVEVYGNNSGSSINASYGGFQRLDVGHNPGFTVNAVISPFGVQTYDYSSRAINCNIINANGGNFAEKELYLWGVEAAGATATVWSRSAVVFENNPEAPVWELSTAGSGSSDRIGFNVLAEDYPQLVGKLVVFSLWTKHAFANDGNADVYLRGQYLTGGNFSSTNTWRLWSGITLWPASGTVSMGVRKIGAAGSIHVAAPVLCEFGASIKTLYGQFGRQTVFVGSSGSAPSAGTWVAGDVVWRSAPAAGAAPGWVCTAGGTPGTWKAMASIAA